MMLSLYCTPDRFNIAEAANINMATRPVEAATQSVVSLVQSRINADNPHSVPVGNRCSVRTLSSRNEPCGHAECRKFH